MCIQIQSELSNSCLFWIGKVLNKAVTLGNSYYLPVWPGLACWWVQVLPWL